ncbi:LLM class flavin-dependent oxidoreductase [Streptomyces fulvoviolaceus]|uniref:LLM class flavin-dependent oxidoreductase n=1 Tax=Streptomyces fulvoviolaceus TaxID=285535 RepID=UPI0005BD507E|nr:LLM class flavin-dependent oxidoreductase [Streptomyces fulvoviolaceus]MCT9083690.1 LLM class flavin-dependent oxidoreductase [Streptomyces fulvoviolaceus]
MEITSSAGPQRFGVFLAPFHKYGQNPTLALERDLDLMVHLDRLGFDEAWIGEHHSGGWELVGAPDLFIATAAERTRRLRFGTGVTSLPYHHPLLTADRMVLLDHLTRGRTMLGVGPGALASDAFMMGVEVARQREMMAEGLEAVVALLRGDGPVNRTTDWFELRDARLQLSPYTKPRFDIAVAGSFSPAGPLAAGRHGCSLMSIAATSAAGFNVLGQHWDVVAEQAAAHGHTADRDSWRIAGPMHLAETREQAIADVAFGLADWVEYFSKVATLPLSPASASHDDLVEAMNTSGFAVIGTPDDAIAQIERLDKQSGGFGTYLLMGNDWADRERTLRSYELFAKYVTPHFQGSLDSLRDSRDWVSENRPTFLGASSAAIESAIRRHNAAGGSFGHG